MRARAVNETYESQKALSDFAEYLVHQLAEYLVEIHKELKEARKKDKSVGFEIELDGFSKDPEIQKFIDYGRFEVYNYIPEGDNVGSYNIKKKTLILYLPLDDIISFIERSAEEDDLNMNQLIQKTYLYLYNYKFLDPAIKGFTIFSIIIHELQHMYDDHRSGGKTYNINPRKAPVSYPEEYLNKLPDKEREVLRDRSKEKYFKLPWEISARFTEAIERVDFLDGTKPLPFRLVLDQFKSNFYKWEMMTPAIQKSLIKKLTNFWNKQIEEFGD